jgi:hypothetical protein
VVITVVPLTDRGAHSRGDITRPARRISTPRIVLPELGGARHRTWSCGVASGLWHLDYLTGVNHVGIVDHGMVHGE